MQVLRMSVVAVMCVTPCLAGDLNPPAGPVLPTMKTLEEVEPRTLIEQSDIPLTISQAGSYYLTSNLFPAGLGDAFVIRVAASNVSIDLRGFMIIGMTEVTTADDGILVDEGVNAVEVHGGTITKCLDAGIDAFTLNFDTRDCLYRNLRLVDNMGAGLETGTNSVVIGCVASRNGGVGIFASPGSVIWRCSASENTGVGITEFLSGEIVIDGCSVYRNTGDGIALGAGCRIVDCNVSSNGGAGIRATSGAVIEGCSVAGNSEEGIIAGSSSIVRSCIASSNLGHGITASSECLIVGNNSSFNASGGGDQIGILVTGRDNRIDSNNCVENDKGIDVDGTENLIVRNSASDSNVVDFEFAAGNDYAEIISNPGSAFVATNPWANFQY